MVAFPSLENHFTDLLTESLFRNNFTDDRFNDAVNYVIDNCRYPKPSIADFVGYDKKIKLLTHADMVNGSLDFNRHKKVRISANQEKPFYVRDLDFELNNFENW